MLIEQRCIDEISKLTEKDELIILLSGERGTFDFLPNLHKNDNHQSIHKEIPIELAHLKMTGFIHKGTHLDYFEIRATDNEENPNLEKIASRFALMNTTYWNSNNILKIENRAKIVTALTLSSLLVGIRKVEYIKNNRNIFEHDSMPVYIETMKLIGGNFKLTNNPIDDVGQLSQFYWYNFPQDLTNCEKEIKRITLEYRV